MLTNWIFWAVPLEYTRKYIITMLMVMIIIPTYIFGLQFTKLGFIINLLWYDLIFYGWFRAKQKIEGDQE